MEVLAQTEYQDMYRIKDGVLLVVNKFEQMEIPGVDFPLVSGDGKNRCKYNKNCQDSLQILKKDFVHEASWMEDKWQVPARTVLYHRRPVKVTTDKSRWKYEIKTTGSMFSGSSDEMMDMLREIEGVING